MAVNKSVQMMCDALLADREDRRTEWYVPTTFMDKLMETAISDARDRLVEAGVAKDRSDTVAFIPAKETKK